VTHLPSRDGTSSLNPTLQLLEAARKGDQRAFDLLFRRYHLRLTAYAHGRLSDAARSQNETGDLVLKSFLNAFQKVRTFEYRRDGAYLGYLFSILYHEVATANRNARRAPKTLPLDEAMVDGAQRADDRVVENERWERYEAALATLKLEEQGLIRMREMGLTFVQMGRDLNRDPNTIRMRVTRALEKLSRAIRDRS